MTWLEVFSEDGIQLLQLWQALQQGKCAFEPTAKIFPIAAFLYMLYRPLLARVDVYKIFFAVSVALAFVIPLDSCAWSHVVLVTVQTYIASILYLLFTKGTFQAVYLVGEDEGDTWKALKRKRNVGFGLLFTILAVCMKLDIDVGHKLLLAFPFLAVIWGVAYPFLLRLPFKSNMVYPALIPTLVLCLVKAERVGLACNVYDEAVHLLLTNIVVIGTLIMFDYALAIHSLTASKAQATSTIPSPLVLTQTLFQPPSSLDTERLHMLRDATRRLGKKSRSFSFASGLFEEVGGGSGLRSDLVLLYSFCRVADDLIDDASSAEEAKVQLGKLYMYLDLLYGTPRSDSSSNVDYMYLPPTPLSFAPLEPLSPETEARIDELLKTFPPDTRLSLGWLRRSDARDRVRVEPLRCLLQGFEMDLEFSSHSPGPIRTSQDLELYSLRVAGTVAELIIDLVLFHYGSPSFCVSKRKKLIRAGREMGVALQYVNIARDVWVDARMGRCYLPAEWMDGKEVIACVSGMAAPDHEEVVLREVTAMRLRLLDDAGRRYEANIDSIRGLPDWSTKSPKEDYVGGVRGATRAAVESYMEIGRRLRKRLEAEGDQLGIITSDSAIGSADSKGFGISSLAATSASFMIVQSLQERILRPRKQPCSPSAVAAVQRKASVSSFRRLVVGWLALHGRTAEDPFEFLNRSLWARRWSINQNCQACSHESEVTPDC